MNQAIITTSQNVQISYALASIGDRILARIIDSIALICYSIAVFFILENVEIWDDIIFVFAFLFYFPVLLYDFLCETFNHGQSLGKYILGIRVVKEDGTMASPSSYLMRWLLYLVEGPMTGFSGILFLLFTKRSQRLGDMAADTIVIKLKDYHHINVTLDEFSNLSDQYKPVYSGAENLSLGQANLIDRTLYMDVDGEQHDYYVHKLAGKVASLLELDKVPANEIRFLGQVLNDYRHFALYEV